MNMLKNINERNGNLSITSLFTLEFQRWEWYSIITPLVGELIWLLFSLYPW